MTSSAAKPQEYQPLTVFFNDASRRTTVEKIMDALYLEKHSYYTHAHFLVPTKIMPVVNDWMHSLLERNERGSRGLIDFLLEKGALLHAEDKPAYTVVASRLLADKQKVLQEEYWLKGQRVPASAVVSRVQDLAPGVKKTF